MRKRIAYLATACVLLFVGAVDARSARAGKGQSNRKGSTAPLWDAYASLGGESAEVEILAQGVMEGVEWVEADVWDEDFPLTVHLVAKPRARIKRVIYLLPSSGLNFRGSYLTPEADGLAYYFARRNYLVVGISPREDNIGKDSVSPDADPSVASEWGLEKHRTDVRQVVAAVQKAVDLPYDVLGHSLGAIVALDYAAKISEANFETVMVLDLPSFGPTDEVLLYGQEPVSAYLLASLSLGAYADLLGKGTYLDASIAALKELVALAALFPTADSGTPRIVAPGNFTLNGLLHYSLIFTAFLPGAISPTTGLPQEWPMILGNAAGFYDFAADPQDDVFGLVHIDIERLQDVAFAVGSGLTPIALARDYTAAISNDEAYLPTYKVEWADVNESVRWINGELGMGPYTYATTLMEAAGNTDIEVTIVPMYGHIDVILSDTAEEDVWKYLFP